MKDVCLSIYISQIWKKTREGGEGIGQRFNEREACSEDKSMIFNVWNMQARVGGVVLVSVKLEANRIRMNCDRKMRLSYVLEKRWPCKM